MDTLLTIGVCVIAGLIILGVLGFCLDIVRGIARVLFRNGR